MSALADTYALDGRGEVIRLGSAVPAGDKISWVPPEARGWVPLHCYLVKVGEVDGRRHAVLVDTSFPAVESTLLDQLGRCVEGGTALTMVLTRQAEYESIGNAAAVLQRFKVTGAWGNNALEESLYFSPRYSPPRQADAGPWWPHGAEVATHGFPGTKELVVGEHRFGLTTAPLRLLATTWVYHDRSGTLFTSDAFATGSLPSPDASPVTDEVIWDAALLRSWLMAKFRWVERADITSIVAQIDDFLAPLDVACVAPAHGWIVRGAAARRLLDDYREILAGYRGPPEVPDP